MIRYTLFDPLSGRVIAKGACSRDEDVWHQPLDGQGIVPGWEEYQWRANGEEGFVRDGDEYLRTADWLDKYWPLA